MPGVHINRVSPMELKTAIGYATGLGALVAMIIGGVNYFQSRDQAIRDYAALETGFSERMELAAGDRETGDINTRIDITRIRIQRLKDIADVRDLTQSELIDLDSYQRELDRLLKRRDAIS